MAVVTMCSSNEPGARRDDHWSKRTDREIWLRNSYVGCVLELHERNGYHDSDFYAVVWDEETSAPKTIEYASTRGWSYPNLATAVDATPEVQAKYAAWQAAQHEAARKRRETSEANTPTKGKRVRVVAGRKIAIGTEAEVFWYGEQREFGFTPRNGYKAHGHEMRRWANEICPPNTGIKEGYRVGLRLDDGSKVFTAATNVEVIG